LPQQLTELKETPSSEIVMASNRESNAVNSFDEVQGCWAGCAGVVTAESMDVTNDPRFFAGSVMNKRLAAFKSLTLVSSLMFGTALNQCFKIKKNMNFSKWDPLVGNIAIWEYCGFILSVIVASMCLLSLYVISHQLFYTTRLTTAGPTGFEQATMFYLTRVIVVWRHIAVSALFNGLWLFILLVGIQFFVTFYKDAAAVTDKHHEVFISNLAGGTSTNTTFIKESSPQKLDMVFHSILAYVCLAIFGVFTCMLGFIRHQHLSVFQINYKKSKSMSDPLETQVRSMSQRSVVAHTLQV